MSTFPGKSVGKSNFNHTCSRLSHFFKEKRSSAPFPLQFAAATDSTVTTFDLLTNLKNSGDASIKNSPHPQMTIFYDGKVLVFDAFQPEKATEIMELATKLSSDDGGRNPSPNPTCTARAPLADNSTVQHPPRSAPQSFGSDMRYPRRASLLKFLEKRKERVISKGPYHNNNQKQEGSSSGGDPEHDSPKQFDLNL